MRQAFDSSFLTNLANLVPPLRQPPPLILLFRRRAIGDPLARSGRLRSGRRRKRPGRRRARPDGGGSVGAAQIRQIGRKPHRRLPGLDRADRRRRRRRIGRGRIAAALIGPAWRGDPRGCGDRRDAARDAKAGEGKPRRSRRRSETCWRDRRRRPALDGGGARSGRSWRRFHGAMRRLARAPRPREQRDGSPYRDELKSEQP